MENSPLRPDTINWIATSLYDLETAKHKNHLEFLGKINNASIPTRYPDDLQRAIKAYSKPIVEDYLVQTKETWQWLQTHPNLQENLVRS